MLSWKRIDIYLIILLSTVALYSLMKLIHQHFNLSNTLQQTNNIATISEQKNTVKKKRSGQLAWTNAYVNDGLANDDQIYTHHTSQTTLTFEDKSSIEMAENTLIKIGQINNKNEIQLAQGIINARLNSASTSEQFKIKIKNKIIDILPTQGAEIQIIQNEDQGQVTLIKGKAYIKKDQENIELNQNQFLNLNHQDDSENLGELQISLKAPAHQEQIFFNDQENNKIIFQWEAQSTENNSFIIEIANDSSFNNISKRHTTNNTQIAITNLPPSSYYWRVKTDLSVHEEIRIFHLKELIAPRILMPENNKNIQIYNNAKTINDDKNNSISLIWEKGIQSKYQLELTNPQNQTTIISLDSNHYKIHYPETGEYKFKIKKQVDQFESAWSPSRKFSVSYLEPPATAFLQFPKQDQEIIFYDDKSMQIHFKWTIETLTPTIFELQIFNNNSPDKPVFIIETLQTDFKWQVLEVGQYFWQILSKSPQGVLGEPSSRQYFSISKEKADSYRPLHEAKLILRRPDQKVTFAWTKTEKSSKKIEVDKEKEEYIFELSEQEDFSSPLHQIKTNNDSIEIGFSKTGIYYWRTKIQNPQIHSPQFSSPLKIIVEPIPPPEKPEIPSLKLNIQKKHSFLMLFLNHVATLVSGIAHAAEDYFYVQLDWEKQEDIKEYLLEVYHDKDLSQLLLQEKVSQNYYIWKNPPVGQFFWRLAFVDFWLRQSEWSIPKEVDITLEDTIIALTEPQLISPKHQSSIQFDLHSDSDSNSDTDLDLKTNETISFSWKPQENARIYKLLISSDLSFEERSIVFKKNTNAHEAHLTLNQIKSGIYYWKVIASGSYNIQKESKRRQFKVSFLSDKTKESSTKISESKKSKGESPSTNSDSTKTDQAPKHFALKTQGEAAITWAYSMDRYESTLRSKTTKLSGSTMSSFASKLKFFLGSNYFIQLNIDYKTGTIFSNQTYTNHSFKGALGFHLKSYAKSTLWGKINIEGNLLTTFTYPAPTFVPVPNEQLFLTPIPSFELHHILTNQLSLNLEVGRGIGGTNTTMGQAMLLLGDKLIYTTGINYLSKNVTTKNKEKINLKEIKFLIGIGITW